MHLERACNEAEFDFPCMLNFLSLRVNEMELTDRVSSAILAILFCVRIRTSHLILHESCQLATRFRF